MNNYMIEYFFLKLNLKRIVIKCNLFLIIIHPLQLEKDNSCVDTLNKQ